jgi:hypothetical protein
MRRTFWIGVAIGVATFVISLWVAIVQFGAGDGTWLWGAILAVLGLAGTILAVKEGLDDAAESRARSIEIAAAREEADRLKARIDKAERGLLTPEGWDLIANAKLSNLATGFAKCSPLPKSGDLAKQLESALHQAGCGLMSTEFSSEIKLTTTPVKNTEDRFIRYFATPD